MSIYWYVEGRMIVCESCCILSDSVALSDNPNSYDDLEHAMKEKKFSSNKGSNVGKTKDILRLFCNNCGSEEILPYNVRKYYSYFIGMRIDIYDHANTVVCEDCCTIDNKILDIEQQKREVDYEFDMDTKDYKKIDDYTEAKDFELYCNRCREGSIVFYYINKYQTIIFRDERELV